MDILTIFFQSMSIEYLSIYFCFLQCLLLISYSFQCIDLSPHWLNLFLSIFILFDAIVNGIVFLISPSDSLLLVYKNSTNFWILIFYPATLLNLFITSNSFWWNIQISFSLYIYVIMSSTNNDHFTSFLIWIPFISSSSSFCFIRLLWLGLPILF